MKIVLGKRAEKIPPLDNVFFFCNSYFASIFPSNIMSNTLLRSYSRSLLRKTSSNFPTLSLIPSSTTFSTNHRINSTFHPSFHHPSSLFLAVPTFFPSSSSQRTFSTSSNTPSTSSSEVQLELVAGKDGSYILFVTFIDANENDSNRKSISILFFYPRTLLLLIL